MANRRGALVLAVLLALAIAFGSALSTQVKFALHTQGALHPWLHLLAFALLTFLLLSNARSSLLRGLLMAGVFALGWGTEYTEHLSDKWPVESRDVLLNSAGVMLGAVIASLQGVARQR